MTSDGELIFITGAPGSMWSAIAFCLSCSDEVNNSDVNSGKSFASASGVLHVGNYFGPGLEYGSRFHQLDRIPKAQLVEEFYAPYREDGGIRLLKSHMFARHLEFLHETFPKARFVVVYRSDDQCLQWWLEAGGFQIGFPDYSWYGEVDNMRREIATDNEAILEFVKRNSVALQRQKTLQGLANALGLSYSNASVHRHIAELYGEETGPDGPQVSEASALASAIHKQSREPQVGFL